MTMGHPLSTVTSPEVTTTARPLNNITRSNLAAMAHLLSDSARAVTSAVNARRNIAVRSRINTFKHSPLQPIAATENRIAKRDALRLVTVLLATTLTVQGYQRSSRLGCARNRVFLTSAARDTGVLHWTGSRRRLRRHHISMADMITSTGQATGQTACIVVRRQAVNTGRNVTTTLGRRRIAIALEPSHW